MASSVHSQNGLVQQVLAIYGVDKSMAIGLPADLVPLHRDLLTVPPSRSIFKIDPAVDPVLFELFLALFSPPPFPHCMRDTLAQLGLCLRHALDVARTARATQACVASSLKRFKDRLDTLTASRRAPSPKECRSFTHARYPVWNFHAAFSPQASTRIKPSYALLAPHLTTYLHILNHRQHQRYDYVSTVRQKPTTNLRIKRLAWYARQARQLVQRFPDRLVPAKRPVKHLLLTDARIDRVAGLRPLLDRFACEPRSLGRGHDSIQWSHLSQAAHSSSFLSTDSDSHDGINARVRVGTHQHSNASEDAALSDAERQDLEIEVPPLHPDMARVESTRAILNRSREIARSRMALPGSYDRRILQLSTLGQLLRQLPLSVPLETIPAQDLVRCTAVWTALLTGQPPASVLSMTVAGPDPGPKPDHSDTPRSIHLTYSPDHNELRYDFPAKWRGYSEKDTYPFLKACVRTTEKIRLPLPPPLDCLYAECVRRGAGESTGPEDQRATRPLLSVDTLPGTSPTQEKAVDRWLKTLTTTRQGPVTLRRLAQSFSVHATQRYGLDPVLAAYAAGQFWWHIRAPLQYTAFPASRLEGDYRATVAQFLHDLAPYVCAPPAPRWWSVLIETRHDLPTPAPVAAPEPSPMTTTRWYGSRCVPDADRVRTYFQLLSEYIRILPTTRNYETHPDARLMRHNYFTLYVHQAWEFGTLTRPRRMPQVNWDRVDLTGRRCLIADKDSRYREERIMVIPDTVATLVKTLLLDVNPATLAYLRDDLSLPIPALHPLDDPFTFLVDLRPRGLVLKSLSPTNMRWAMLQGPDDLPALFPYPSNVHRHYVRSYLFNEIKAEFDAINFAMSHKHFGYEPYHVYAGTDSPRMWAELTRWLDRCLADLGIQALPW